jgi:hypothetical protein
MVKALVWSDDTVEHISRHAVTPKEFEQYCFGRSIFRRAKSEGMNPVYYAYGQTDSGRYLLCIFIKFPDGNGYPVTAREMTPNEKRRHRRDRRR